MHASSRPSDPFRPHLRSPSRPWPAAALAVLIVLPVSATVHAQSTKRDDRVPPLPAAIALDAEGIARDAREVPPSPAPTLPDVERPDLPPQPPSPQATGVSAAAREALIAAARRRHPEQTRAAIEAMVRRIAAELAFDAEFAATIARVESGFDPFAVSDKGAIGVMQLMPGVIQDQSLADPFDAEANIRAGVRQLKALGQELRHPVLVAAAYHAGAEAVRSARGIPKDPRTAEYVVAVLNGFYDLMAIAGSEAARPAAARPAPARISAATASVRSGIRTARADTSAPTNPTGIWERGFVLHLD